jgi:hypothetical protein
VHTQIIDPFPRHVITENGNLFLRWLFGVGFAPQSPKPSTSSGQAVGGTVLYLWVLKSPRIGEFRGSKSQSITVQNIDKAKLWGEAFSIYGF